MADRKEGSQTHPARSRTTEEKVDGLNDQAWGLRHSQAERAMALSQKAYQLSTSGKFSERPYRQGQAASLLTQGFLNHQNGKLDIALAQCFEASGYLESLPPSWVSIDTSRIISWIYFFLGDQANALSYGLKALHLAQELNLRVQEASVLDVLATIYVTSGDKPRTVQSQEKALRIAREEEDRVLESVVLNNLALNLLEMGELPGALESAEKSLRIARELSLPEKELSTMDTLGQILERMGKHSQAEKILCEGLEMAIRLKMPLGQIYCLLNLGKISLSKKEAGRAGSYFRQGLKVATSIGARPLEMECHRALSDLAEKQGKLRTAIEHSKLFYALSDQLHSEAAEKRVAALKVALQVETAQRDAEIYRLRTVELQSEIEERRRMEAKLEKLATSDPLTNLFSRAHYLKLAERELVQARRYHRSFTMVMIDIDHFKEVNDTYGHSTGDQVLVEVAAFLQNSLRGADIVGRMGGDEFCAALPETNGEQALIACQRLRHTLDKRPLKTSSGALSVTVSMGIAALSDGEHASKEKLDDLLERADRALYAAKRAGRNRVEVSRPAEPSPLSSSE